VALRDDLERIAGVAATLVGEGERVAAVLPAEPARGARGYLCAYEDDDGNRSWLALDDVGRAVTERRELRDVVSIAALCEIAEENAGGGDLDALAVRLEALRGTGRDDEIAEALEAIGALRHELGVPPQLATPARLDAIGVATRRLEIALDPAAGSPFAAAMRTAQGAVDELTREVEARYRVELSG
jgi:hypothetical protein